MPADHTSHSLETGPHMNEAVQRVTARVIAMQAATPVPEQPVVGHN